MKLNRKIRSLLVSAMALLMILSSCGLVQTAESTAASGTYIPDEDVVEYDDNYKNFYEIFVRSFSDSDGDQIGDFNGITSKLDYLKAADGEDDTNSLGINGIWLMPICPSPSYHKYDVTDYKAVDSSYGTMEDFENMLAACHERGISVIIDMVFNHTSSEHEWFTMFCDNLRAEANGEELPYDEKYSEYYVAVTEDEKASGRSYKPITGTDYYYECNFSDDMPELNYDSEYVWEEIESICDFWIDKGVDGFRFDAVLYFYYGNNEKSIEVLERIVDYCHDKNPDFYMVGEAWTSSNVIKNYYTSGIDSLFNFQFANTSGLLATTVKSQSGSTFAQRLQNWNNALKLISDSDAIDAPFLSNHDMYRSSGYFQTLSQQKMAASLYLLMPGNTFIYYGEEIGLKGTSTDTDKKDPTARLAMKWSEEEDGTNIARPSGSDLSVTQDDIDSVEDQWEDENSLLNHYKALITLKNQNPEIARGTVTACDFGESTICAYTCIYNGVAVMVIHNLSTDDATFDLNELGYSDFTELRGYVKSEGLEGETETSGTPVFGESSEEESDEDEEEVTTSLKDGVLTIPGRTTVILRSTEHYDDVVISSDSITTSADDDKVEERE